MAVLAAVGLAAAVNPLRAEPAAAEAPAGEPQAGAVVLPTGDLIRPTADGSFTTEPDAAAFHTAREPDGDRLVVPVGALPALAAGEFSLAQFNIDAMTRLGITDAGGPGAAAALAAESEAAPRGGDPALVAVDFTALWPDGSAPDATFLRWIDVDTGEYMSDIVDGGSATLELAPGHYQMVPSMDRYEERVTIAGVLDLHVDADPEPVVFDGAAAVATGFALDRATEPQGFEYTAFSYLPGTQDGVQGGMFGGGEWEVRVVPTGFDPEGREVGVELRQEFTSPAGAAEPYSYSLYGSHDAGIPADAVFRVADDELARVDMDYDSLGVDTELYRANLAVHDVRTMSGYLDSGPVALPSERTEFYTADPHLSWSHVGVLGLGSGDGEEEPLRADVMHHSGVLEPGSVTGTGWNQGPVTVGVDLAGAAYYLPRFYRWEDAGLLLTNPSMHSSGSPDEAANTYDAPGQTVLAQDGLGIAKSEYGGSLATDLALVPAGRYTLYSESYRDVPWTDLGTAATAEWSFTTAPTGADTVLPVSVVNFDAEGIENGYADAGAVQEVELDFTTQPGAEQQVCTAMTFEVSYDDGATWTPVAIDRDGNHATAELAHPAGAEYVSVRFTAADEAGGTVAHSTIRSYGLR
ncbi:hypothetical protein AB0A73_04965 [Glycomyces sp. NPDC047369]